MVASENLILRKFWIHLAIDDIFRVFESGYFSSEDLEKLMRFITKLRTILVLGIILLLSSIQQGLAATPAEIYRKAVPAVVLAMPDYLAGALKSIPGTTVKTMIRLQRTI